MGSNTGAVIGAITGSICAVLLVLLAFSVLTRRSRSPRAASLATSDGAAGRRRSASASGERGYYKQGGSSKVNRRSNRSSARFAPSPLSKGAPIAASGDVRASDFRSATSMYQVEPPRQAKLQYAALPPETPSSIVSASGIPPPPKRGGGGGTRAPPPPPAAHHSPGRAAASSAPPVPSAGPPPASVHSNDGGAWMQF